MSEKELSEFSVEDLQAMADNIAATRMQSEDVAAELEANIGRHKRKLEELQKQLRQDPDYEDLENTPTLPSPDPDGDERREMQKSLKELKEQADKIKNQFPDIENLTKRFQSGDL